MSRFVLLILLTLNGQTTGRELVLASHDACVARAQQFVAYLQSQAPSGTEVQLFCLPEYELRGRSA